MREAALSLTENIYGAYRRGDNAFILAALSPDVEWHSSGRASDFPALGPRKGVAQVEDFFATVKKHVEFLEFVPKEYYADKDKVIVLGHYVFRMRANGRTVTSDWVHIFTHRDGKVVKFREFLDTAQLAEAYRG